MHTVLGCLIWRMPCYNKGKCRVFLVCVFSRVWKFLSQIQAGGSMFDKCNGLRSYRFRCSRRLKRRPHVGIGHECDFCG